MSADAELFAEEWNFVIFSGSRTLFVLFAPSVSCGAV